MSNGDTEGQRFRDKEDSEETDDFPQLSASIKTLQEAVQISLEGGLNKNSLFKFARALRAFEMTTNRRLPLAEVPGAFSLWWNTATSLLPPDANFDEWRFAFEQTFTATRVPWGGNPLQEAVRLADATAMPPQAEKYSSTNLKRLVAVCFQLQKLAGNELFFISVRDAAKILGKKSPFEGSAMLAGLVRDGVLTSVKPGQPGGNQATRFRFNLSADQRSKIDKQSQPSTADSQAKTEKRIQRKRPRIPSDAESNCPPDRTTVIDYAKSIGCPEEIASLFYNYYASGSWMLKSGVRMMDFKPALNNWFARELQNPKSPYRQLLESELAQLHALLDAERNAAKRTEYRKRIKALGGIA